MDKNYKAYECPICGCEFAIYMPTMVSGRCVTCPLDGRHKNILVCGSYDSLTECMNHAKYKRNGHGAVEQDG